MKINQLIRISHPITFFLGKEFEPSLDLVEIDITYECNLKCFNCDRSCTQAPSNEHMSINQIEKFIDMSNSNAKEWGRIRILGGEPFLHPDIDNIIQLFDQYKKELAHKTKIEVVTNGYGRIVKQAIIKVPKTIEVKNTRKIERYQKKFEAFNLAPKDKGYHKFTDFSNACWVTSYCGINLNPYGYYLCGAGGSIDRVIGKDIGLKEFPISQTEFHIQAKELCKYCGHFSNRQFLPVMKRKPVIGEPKSKSWQDIYDNYERKKPSLTRYE